MEDDRLVGIELEISLRSGKGDRVVVSEDLNCHLSHRLALRGVDLARHDGGARFVFGKQQLADSGARSGAHQRMSLAIFMRAPASVRKEPLVATDRVVRRDRGKFVGRRNEGQGWFRWRSTGPWLRRTPPRRIQPRAHGSGADGEFVDADQRLSHIVDGTIELATPSPTRSGRA